MSRHADSPPRGAATLDYCIQRCRTFFLALAITAALQADSSCEQRHQESIDGSFTHALPVKTFDIRHYGAMGDGRSLDTAAIQKAIDAAAAANGGQVTFPPGVYLSGSIRLKNRVHLYLEKGATLLGSEKRENYQRLNFLALVLADKQEDIGISGEGVIDGQGKLLAASVEGTIKPGKFPDANEAKRPVIINFRDCSNITVRNVTLRESACWVQLYRNCEKVLLENLTVRTMAAVTNDGLDIDGCSNVIVRGCDIDSEDDGICLKSSSSICENVLIENCRVRSSCNALKFGTASYKGFKNITCRNLEIYDTYLSGIALECVDGGILEKVNISKVRMTDTNNPIFIRLGQRDPKRPAGFVRGVTISDVTAEIPNRRKIAMNKFPPSWRHQCQTLVTASVTGLPGNPVRDVTLKNISILYGGIGPTPKPDQLRIDQVPECAENYPESKMFGTLPAWGLYCRHADGIKLENITFRVKGQDYRPALVCDDVSNLDVNGFRFQAAGMQSVMMFKDLTTAVVSNSLPPQAKGHQVQRSDTLAGPWTRINLPRSGTGGILNLKDSDGNNGNARYYRVLVSP